MWVARDKIGELYLYEHKPIRKETIWSSDEPYEFIEDKCNLFRKVKWSDPEPTEIKLVNKE